MIIFVFSILINNYPLDTTTESLARYSFLCSIVKKSFISKHFCLFFPFYMFLFIKTNGQETNFKPKTNTPAPTIKTTTSTTKNNIVTTTNTTTTKDSNTTTTNTTKQKIKINPSDWEHVAPEAQDQMIIVSTVATMALLVGALSARRLRSRQFLSSCIENESLEDELAYDTAYTTDNGSILGSGRGYDTFSSVPWQGDLEKFDV